VICLPDKLNVCSYHATHLTEILLLHATHLHDQAIVINLLICIVTDFMEYMLPGSTLEGYYQVSNLF
jgi:hypothetical protein